MKKIKAKASSLPLFNGKIFDSSTSTSSTSSSVIAPTKQVKRATFNGATPANVFAISNSFSSVSSLLRDQMIVEKDIECEQVKQQLDNSSNSTDKSLNIVGAELNNYEKIKIVGQGSFGVAILYRRKCDNQRIVFKQINLVDLTPAERDLAMNEVEVFSKLHHPNIISYLGSFIKDNTLLIEMEYADGGTLAQILAERAPKDYFPERYIISIFEQITSAINYMHTENILHRDLKTANIFLNKRGIVKIGDFGISKIMNTKIHAHTVLGTPYYFSPEMCEGKEYDHKSDIWALGCILGEMCCLKKSFAATNLSELVTKIMAGSYTPLPSGYSSGLRYLLSVVLQVDASKRPTATEILDYWIPLIFRSLGKHKGFSYGHDISVDIKDKSDMDATVVTMSEGVVLTEFTKFSAEPPTARAATKEIMNAETVAPEQTVEKRSVMYQLKAFGKSFSMDPIQLPPKACILSVAISESHFVVVNDDGSVYTWGEGTLGQLGLNSLDTWKHYPSRVESLRNCHIVGACAGDGFTILLTQSGALLSFGDNSHCVLGHSDSKMQYTPKTIEKLEGIRIKQVEAGLKHVMALSFDGSIYTWGTNAQGALGLGSFQKQQKVPQKILLSNSKSKAQRIVCGPDASAIIFANGDLHVCGSNEKNKLGFNKPNKIMAFKKVTLPQKVIDVAISATHSVVLVLGGYVITMGRNTEGQRGLGHCCAVVIPTPVAYIKDRYITHAKCNELCTIVASEDNIITFWGTRNGIPDIGEPIGKNQLEESHQKPSDLEIGNNTAAFTNFLTSVYKSELLLQPKDLLALYASEEQFDKGYYVKINNFYPLTHSVLVVVDTTTPLICSLEEFP